jgi:secreted PhoX family phosphatase
MTPTVAGDLTLGKVEVMKVHGFTGNAALNGTGQAGRTGAGEWVAIVDADGNALTTADPFDFTSRGGRTAADEVGATPFGRPEDLEIATLANGNESIFMATTSENIVWSIELDADGNEGVNVTEFINSLTTPSSLQSPVGEGIFDTFYGLDDVDNLALEIGPNGEIQLFVVEDENPSDIWLATDADGDGIAEIIDLFASLGVAGAEATGFIVDPRGGYLVNIQHPNSGNDALWSITQASVVPVPSAVWLFGSGLIGLIGIARRKHS